MRPGNHLTHPLRKVVHHRSRLCRGTDEIYIVAQIVCLLHERERHYDTLFGASVYVHVACGIVNSYYIIIYGVYSDELSARVSSARKQSLIHLLAYDAHLAALAYVHLVDISAVEHLGTLHLCIIGHRALYDAVALLVAESGVAVPSRQHRSDYVQLRHLRLQAFHILVCHVPLTAFPQSVIRLCGRLREHYGRVGGKSLEVV